MATEWYPEGERSNSDEALQRRYESFTDLEGSFGEVIHCLMVATIDVGGLTEEQREAMITTPNFWSFHTKLVQALETTNPGVTARIFEQAERVNMARIQEEEARQKRAVSKLTRSAIWRAIIGVPPVY